MPASEEQKKKSREAVRRFLLKKKLKFGYPPYHTVEPHEQLSGEQSHLAEPRHFTRATCVLVNRSEIKVGGNNLVTMRRPSTRAHPEEVSKTSTIFENVLTCSGNRHALPATREYIVPAVESEHQKPTPKRRNRRRKQRRAIKAVESSIKASPLPEIQPTSIVKAEPDEQDLSHLVQCELEVAEIPPERAFAKQNELSIARSPDERNLKCPGDEDASVNELFDGWQVHSIVPVSEIKSSVLQIEFGFRFKSENFPQKGTMRYYDCRMIKFRSRPQCERKLLVFIPNSDSPATISIKGKHTCGTAPPENLARAKLNQHQSALIEGLLKAGLPSKDIKKHVKLENSMVSKNQLSYAVKSTRQKLFGTGVFSIGELEQWVVSKSAVPNDEREGFVIGKDIDHENKSFRIIFSSKRLLSILTKFNVAAADCTFKVTLEGYPLLVVVVLDKMRHAHPVAFGILSKQDQTDYQFSFQAIIDACTRFGFTVAVTTFMSDGELAIKKAARIVFNEPTILNCYFHVVQNISKHLKKNNEVPNEMHAQIKRDIGLLQVSPTTQHFVTGMKLFLRKYERFPDFIQFMQKYAYDKNFCQWYEAAKPTVPATNNALEALNKSIKYNHMNRHKEPLSSFKTIILNIIYEYGDPMKAIAQERTVNSFTNERKTFDWLKLGKKMRTCQAPVDGKQFVYVPGKYKKEISLLEIQAFEHPDYRTFEQFSEDFGNFYRVDVSSDDWNSWNCTCYYFLKKNFCCHVLAVAVKRQKYVLSTGADTTPMGRKKPTGRPKTVSKALIVD